MVSLVQPAGFLVRFVWFHNLGFNWLCFTLLWSGGWPVILHQEQRHWSWEQCLRVKVKSRSTPGDARQAGAIIRRRNGVGPAYGGEIPAQRPDFRFL